MNSDDKKNYHYPNECIQSDSTKKLTGKLLFKVSRRRVYKECIVKINYKSQLIISSVAALLISANCFAEINIDDFTSGQMSRIQTDCAVAQGTVNGNMAGGGRRIRLSLANQQNCNANVTQRYVSSSVDKGATLGCE